jgi:hypothetical protein
MQTPLQVSDSAFSKRWVRQSSCFVETIYIKDQIKHSKQSYQRTQGLQKRGNKNKGAQKRSNENKRVQFWKICWLNAK